MDNRVLKLKRLFDILVVLIMLPICVPLFLIIGLFVGIKLGRPVLFQQIRPGRYGKPFLILKFRTMVDTSDDQNNHLSDDQRLASFGKLLRSTSLDELPELWNVLKGDMSLVGPRPLLMEYLPLYNAEQARRHEVRPGITGWAQVNGRNAISWEEKFKFDVWYVKHYSFGLDMKILWMTVIKVLKREDISAAGEVTMQKFMGNKR